MIQNRLKTLIAEYDRINGGRLTYRSLSAKTGLSKTTLSRYGTQAADRFDAETLSKLCAFFEVGVGDLLVYVPDVSAEIPDQEAATT